MPAGVITGLVTGGAALTLMARLRGTAGQLVTQASLSAIAWQATDLLVGTVVGSGTFVIASTVFNSLVQNDPRWTADSAAQPGTDGQTGYNFLGLLAAGTLPFTTPGGRLTPAPARPYQIDVKFTATDSSVFYAVYSVSAIPVYF